MPPRRRTPTSVPEAFRNDHGTESGKYPTRRTPRAWMVFSRAPGCEAVAATSVHLSCRHQRRPEPEGRQRFHPDGTSRSSQVYSARVPPRKTATRTTLTTANRARRCSDTCSRPSMAAATMTESAAVCIAAVMAPMCLFTRPETVKSSNRSEGSRNNQEERHRGVDAAEHAEQAGRRKRDELLQTERSPENQAANERKARLSTLPACGKL